MTTQNPLSHGHFEDLVSKPFADEADRSKTIKTGKRRTPRGRNRDIRTNNLTDPSFSQQWYLSNTGQTGGTPGIDLNVVNVWSEYTGAGVKVGIIDDGVQYSHSDLDSNYDTTIDYDAGQGDDDAAPVYSDPYFSDDHGTSVAGIIASEANNGIGGKGIAYNATIAGIRMDFYGGGANNQDTVAFQKAANFDVVNNSWGYTSPFADNFSSPAFRASSLALQRAAQTGRQGLGTVVVFAGGNGRQGYDNANYHSYQNSRFSIAVGALNHNGIHTYYSTPGANLLVSAFGGEADLAEDGIFSTDRPGKRGYSANDYFSDFGGTSAATPMVTGVVALMLEANPKLGYRDVQEILAYSARQTDVSNTTWQTNKAKNWNGGGLHTSSDYGFGLVDAHAAVRLAETWKTQGTAANERVVTVRRSPNLAIPDVADAVTDTATVTAGLNIDRVEVELDIDHPWIGDLEVSLVSPDGTTSLLLDQPADPYSFYVEKGSLSQEDLKFTFSSTQYWGETGVGNWKLVVRDRGANDVGTVKNWSLKLYGDTLSEDSTYIYTNEFGTLANSERAVINDTSGVDIINASAVSSNSVLNLNSGTSSTLAGKNLLINGVIEQAFGGDGQDTILGNTAQNTISGGRGNDNVDGGAEADYLKGERGNDILTGGIGDDAMVGQFGSDTLSGGEGRDQFTFTGRVFRAIQSGVDTITDFLSNTDSIVIGKTMFSSLTSTAGKGFSTAREFATVTTDTAAKTSAALIVYNRSNGRLFYNENGSLADFGNGGQFAALSAQTSLSRSDFQIQV